MVVYNILFTSGFYNWTYHTLFSTIEKAEAKLHELNYEECDDGDFIKIYDGCKIYAQIQDVDVE
jgi:hypothetical protein